MDFEFCTQKTIVIGEDLYCFRDPFKDEEHDRQPLEVTKYEGIKKVGQGFRPAKILIDTFLDPEELRRPKFGITYDQVSNAIYLTGGEEKCEKAKTALKFDLTTQKFMPYEHLPQMSFGRVNHSSIVLKGTLYVFGGAMRIFEDTTITSSNQDSFQGEATIEKLFLGADPLKWFQLRPPRFPQQAYMSIFQDTDHSCILLGGDTFHSNMRSFWKFDKNEKKNTETVRECKKNLPRWFETICGNNQVYKEREDHILVFGYADWEDKPLQHGTKDEPHRKRGYCLLRVKISAKGGTTERDVQIVHKIITP